MYNFSLGEVLGKKLNEVIIPEELFEEGRELSQITFKGDIADKETFRKRKDGTLVNMRILGVPIHIDGKVKSIFAIYEDLTVQKNAEKARIQEAEYRAHTAELYARLLNHKHWLQKLKQKLFRLKMNFSTYPRRKS